MRVIDGDTFILWSVNVPPEERVRLLGVDTPELREDKGPEAKAFTEAWLTKGPFRLMACKRDSFGRLLGTLMREGETLADALKARGLAK
jgi:micrococcal nuclease